MKASQRCCGSGSRRCGPCFRYCRWFVVTPRCTPLASVHQRYVPRPQVTLAAAICRIKSLSSCARRGLPVDFDFQRQKSRNPLRCHRSRVSGLTITRAPRHTNSLLSCTIIHRVELSARRGLILRSWNSTPCFRRKRLSAARARCERAALA